MQQQPPGTDPTLYLGKPPQQLQQLQQAQQQQQQQGAVWQNAMGPMPAYYPSAAGTYQQVYPQAGPTDAAMQWLLHVQQQYTQQQPQQHNQQRSQELQLVDQAVGSMQQLQQICIQNWQQEQQQLQQYIVPNPLQPMQHHRQPTVQRLQQLQRLQRLQQLQQLQQPQQLQQYVQPAPQLAPMADSQPVQQLQQYAQPVQPAPQTAIMAADSQPVQQLQQQRLFMLQPDPQPVPTELQPARRPQRPDARDAQPISSSASDRASRDASPITTAPFIQSMQLTMDAAPAADAAAPSQHATRMRGRAATAAPAAGGQQRVTCKRTIASTSGRTEIFSFPGKDGDTVDVDLAGMLTDLAGDNSPAEKSIKHFGRQVLKKVFEDPNASLEVTVGCKKSRTGLVILPEESLETLARFWSAHNAAAEIPQLTEVVQQLTDYIRNCLVQKRAAEKKNGSIV